jgi:hypothetical protein
MAKRGETGHKVVYSFKAAYKAKDVQDIAQDLERTLNLLSAVMIAKTKLVSTVLSPTLLTFSGLIRNGIQV